MLLELLPRDTFNMTAAVLMGVVSMAIYQVVTWYIRYRRWVEVYDRLPRDKDRHWCFGHIHKHPGPGEDGIAFQMSYIPLFPRVHAVWFSGVRCVIICHHPDVLRTILRTSAHIALKPKEEGSIYHFGLRWLGDGLLIANGQKWARNRRLLTPAFHFDMLKSYLDVKNACTDILLNKLNSYAEKGEPFEVFEHIGLCSLDIITQCSFSYRTDCQTQREASPYVKAVHRLTELWILRSLNVLHLFDFFYFNLTKNGREFARLCDLVHSVSEDIINKRRAATSTVSNNSENGAMSGHDSHIQNKKSKDFLDIILTARDEDGCGLSHLDVRNEVDTFLFEGHDTTTSAMSFILYYLAKHPDIQTRCREEVNHIFRGRETDTVEYPDLPKMEYLTQCIKEGLRLATPVFMISRKMTEDLTLDGHFIPKGTNLMLDLHNLHHHPEVWGDDHQEFRPDRFDPETVRSMDPFAFLPFSAGQRNCIGQNFAMNEIKIIISRLLYRYMFTVAPGPPVEKRMSVVMRTKSGIHLNIQSVHKH